jgi:hemerythrin superfamily protein
MQLRRTKRSYGRGAGTFAGGLVLGALGSRLLPPMVAMVSGSVRTQLGGNPFELLRQDHRSILSTLDTMQQLPDDSVAKRTASFLALKRTLGKHALAEENVVYPVLREHANAEEDARRLYAEHAEMKVHMFELESSINTVSTWKARIRMLDGLIRHHIRDEEEKEFPRLEEMLEESRAKTIAGQIRREEALVL